MKEFILCAANFYDDQLQRELPLVVVAASI